MLAVPAVLLASTLVPKAVLSWELLQLLKQVWLCAVGKSVKQSATAIRRTPRRQGDRLTKFVTGRVAVLKGVGRFIGSFFLLPVVNGGTIQPGQDGELPGADAPCSIQVLFCSDDSANIPAICQD